MEAALISASLMSGTRKSNSQRITVPAHHTSRCHQTTEHVTVSACLVIVVTRHFVCNVPESLLPSGSMYVHCASRMNRSAAMSCTCITGV